MLMKDIEKEIYKINTKIEILKEDIKPLENKKQELINRKQNICPHNNVVLSGGEMWHEWPDYGRYPYCVECLDCGLYGNSENDPKVYKILRPKVTINKTRD